MRYSLSFIFLICFLLSTYSSKSQSYEKDGVNFSAPKKYDPNTLTRMLFIFDDSYSMYGTWNSGTKIDIAKKLMGEFLDSIKSTGNLEIALRCYGHQTPFRPKRNCEDSKLEVPFAPAAQNVKLIKDRINRLEPTGTTPIAYSLGECANDFPAKDNVKNVVVLITDGIEECGGDPCAVSAALQKKGIFLRPFVIGVGLDVKFADVFGCMGKFYDVSNEANFKTVLKLVLIEALSQTTVQVNLNDINKKPNESNVTMTFYDQADTKIKYNYLHTLNHRGNPDTIILDPDYSYRIKVHTIPPIEKNNVHIEKGRHNTISIDAAQGFLAFQVDGNNLYKNIDCIIRKHGDMNTINIQEIGKTEKYLVGKYDVEILTLPRINVKDAEIKQSFTNTIKIPAAGQLTLNKGIYGYGSIYLEDGKKLSWVCNMNDAQINEIIYLQPGKYRAEFRVKTELEAERTIERKFTIESGKYATVKFF